MQLSEIVVGLGAPAFEDMLKHVSMGKLKTYKLFERVKTRCHVNKLNTETLRKSAPRLWDRMAAADDELATELTQAILICHLELIVDVLNFLGIPHEDGFFAKDAEVAGYLKDGWQERCYDEFSGKHPKSVLLLYLNHLGWEMAKTETVFNRA